MGRPLIRQQLDDEASIDSLLDERAHQLRERLRLVLRNEVAPRASHLDRTGEFAGASYQSLAEAGLAGLLFPAELGGTGDSTVSYSMAVEEIASVSAATSLVYVTQMHAGYPIALAGSKEQRFTYIPALCDGSMYGSLAITEPGAGSDVSSLRTIARRDGGHYILNGSKTFITSGDVADVVVLFATVERDAGRRGITAFLVPGDVDGLSRGRPLHKMGMHGSSTAELFLDNVRLPDSARLGSEGGGWSISMSSLDKSRISAAAQGVGVARAAYARTVRALHVSGPPSQDVAFVLAEMRARVLSSRAHLLTTAAAMDIGSHEMSIDVAATKLLCTDLAVEMANLACELLGPRGDLQEYGVEQLLRDAKVTQIYDGTNEIQRLIIGRDIQRRIGGLAS